VHEIEGDEGDGDEIWRLALALRFGRRPLQEKARKRENVTEKSRAHQKGKALHVESAKASEIVRVSRSVVGGQRD
jgi:hypothetical protein